MSIKDYLTLMVDMREAHPGMKFKGAYCCMEDFVLQEGRAFPNRKPTARALEVMDEIQTWCPPEQQQCFYNAHMAETYLHRQFPGLRYVEGYARRESSPLAVLHAWLIFHGVVIDPTWDVVGPETGDYYGVVMPTRFARQHGRWEEGDDVWAGSVIDRWQIGFPILKQKWSTTLRKWRDGDREPLW